MSGPERRVLAILAFALLAWAPLFSTRAAAQEEEEEQAQQAQQAQQVEPTIAPIPRLRLGGPLGAQMPAGEAAPVTDEEADDAVEDAVGGELGADAIEDEGWGDDQEWDEPGWEDPFAADTAEGSADTGEAEDDTYADDEAAGAEGEHEAEHEGAHAPGASHGEHGEHGEEHHAASITDFDFLASIVNFILWAVIVVVLFRKPLTAFLVGRRREVEEGLEEAGRLKEEAEAKYADYSERLERLDEELEKLRNEMIQAGESERDRIIAEAESRAARMRKDAQFVIDQQLKQLKTDLTREAVEAAISAAEKALIEQIGGGDQQRLADDYLSAVSETIKDEEVRA